MFSAKEFAKKVALISLLGITSIAGFSQNKKMTAPQKAPVKDSIVLSTGFVVKPDQNFVLGASNRSTILQGYVADKTIGMSPDDYRAFKNNPRHQTAITSLTGKMQRASNSIYARLAITELNRTQLIATADGFEANTPAKEVTLRDAVSQKSPADFHNVAYHILGRVPEFHSQVRENVSPVTTVPDSTLAKMERIMAERRLAASDTTKPQTKHVVGLTETAKPNTPK